MKKKLFLFLIPFLFISKVSASELNDWADTIQYPFTNTRFYSGSTNVVGDSTTLTTSSGRIFHAPYPGSTISVGAYGNPLTFANYVNQMLTPGYLYSYGVYHCQYQSISSFQLYFTASYNALNTSWYGTQHNEDYLNTYRRTNTELSGYPTSNHFNRCYKEVVLFSVSSDSSWVGMAMYAPGGQTLTQSAWIGYDLQNVGSINNLTASDVQNIINNSGFATASSVNQVQRSVNQVQQELEGVQQKQQETTDAVNDVNDSINNDDVSDAEDSAGGFFNDFTTDTHGLTAVITAPLSLISSITSSSCSPLVIPLPYVDKDLTLPCMSTIYSNYFGSFLSIYQMITFGIVAYWVLVRIFNLVKDFKNPDHDEIEVLDL